MDRIDLIYFSFLLTLKIISVVFIYLLYRLLLLSFIKKPGKYFQIESMNQFQIIINN